MAAEPPQIAIPRRSRLPFMGVSLRKRSAFYTQLARTLNAGIGPVRALGILAGQRGSFRLARAAAAMAADTQAGRRLSEAFARHPNIFPLNEVRMIEGGGFAGREPETMLRIAQLLDRIAYAKGRVLAGLVYPGFCLLAAFAGLPLLVAFFMGKVEALLRVQAITAATVLVIWFALALAFRSAADSSALKGIVHATALHVPLFGKLLRRLALARFAETFRCLYEAGVMVPEAMERAAVACGNTHIGGRIARTVPSVRQGTSVTEALARSGVIPVIGLNLIEIGEHAGALDSSLQKFAEYQHDDLEVGIERLSRILPAAAIFLMIVILAYTVIKAWGAYVGAMNTQMGG